MTYHEFVDIAVGVIGTAIIGIALYYTSRTFKRNSQTEELKLSKEIVNDFDDLDKSLFDTPNDQLGMWEQRLFNRLEWVSLLMNNNRIKLEELREYFEPLVVSWYTDAFLKYAKDSDKQDPNQYKEFKKLYKSLQEPKPPENKLKIAFRNLLLSIISRLDP